METLHDFFAKHIPSNEVFDMINVIGISSDYDVIYKTEVHILDIIADATEHHYVYYLVNDWWVSKNIANKRVLTVIIEPPNEDESWLKELRID